MVKKALKNGKQTKLLLLDSNAIIHRAYHALPDLSDSRGEPTGALYGLVAMLLKSVQDLKPDYIVAMRDREEKTHRHEAYEAYKGTRAKTDEPLIAQLKRMTEVFDAFGIPVMDKAGFEADDIIGTVAEQAKKHKDILTIILTGDMDMLQLIDDGRVTVYRLLTGISNMGFFDEAAVKEKYGFGPEHVTDYKGMRGDPSDNIKGIKGIGEKTATDLIQKFGSIEDIYKALKKNPETLIKKGIKTRIVELLTAGEKDALFSKQLATIHRNAPVTFELPDHPWRLKDHIATVGSFCDTFEFRSLKERALALAGSPEAPVQDILESETAQDATHQDVDPNELAETSIALWLLHSDLTNPSLQQILDYAKEKDFTKAKAYIFDALKKTGKLADVYEKIERPLIPVVRRMNETGVAIDVKHLHGLAKEYGKELAAIASRIYRHAGHEFNISSPKQLGDVLFDELKITPVKQKMTATGARTTKESELEKLADMHPIIGDVLSFRELQKLLSTYIEKIPALVSKDGRLRAEFLQAGTTTGRMGSQDPNLQNIPIKTEYGRRIREAFAAPSGKTLAAIDYSQIELRIAAGLSGDKKLIKVFKEGGDVHAAVASEVFGVAPENVDKEMRRRAKVINFGILYGMGVNALKTNLGTSREDAAKFLDAYFERFSGLRTYIEDTKASAKKLGYTETLFGRRRYFPGFKSSMPQLRAQAERMAINAPMQGTQSDIIKLAMVEADALIEKEGWRDKAQLVLQVHDELVYELSTDIAEKAARAIRDVMEGVVSAKELSGVPIAAEISIGKNWGYMNKLKR